MDVQQFRKLLGEGENSWLDWKASFPRGLLQGSNSPGWKQGKGELLKDLISIANSHDEREGFLVYGVKDRGAEREVVGIKKRWDDADFQTWAARAFSPPPHFSYAEIALDDGVSVAGPSLPKHVGVFTIEQVPEYPHVVAEDIGDTIYQGQVWFRRGTQNTIALHDDLKTMFSHQPCITEKMEGSIYQKTKEHYAARGQTVQWQSYTGRDDRLEENYRLAYYPGSRRPIVIYHSGLPDLILMVRP